MKVLVACETSGVVRQAFEELGHDSWSCDLLPSDVPSNKHFQGDVYNILNKGWDLMIAHPPCTRLCNSGVRWLNERNLWNDMKEAAKFFKVLMNSNIPKICIENPIPHGYAVQEIGRKYDQIIQPWMFGHGETKATCLWLKGLPLLKPTNVVSGREHRIHNLAPSADRWKQRSKTFEGIGKAMASQWNY